MPQKPNRRSKSATSTSQRASSSPHQMSAASKVALASAAGVIAATAAGLATTRTGRRISRNFGKTVSPLVHRQLRSVIDTIETALADAGVLEMIPPKVRKQVHDRLIGAAAAGDGAVDQPRRRSARSRTRATAGRDQ